MRKENTQKLKTTRLFFGFFVEEIHIYVSTEFKDAFEK